MVSHVKLISVAKYRVISRDARIVFLCSSLSPSVTECRILFNEYFTLAVSVSNVFRTLEMSQRKTAWQRSQRSSEVDVMLSSTAATFVVLFRGVFGV